MQIFKSAIVFSILSLAIMVLQGTSEHQQVVNTLLAQSTNRAIVLTQQKQDQPTVTQPTTSKKPPVTSESEQEPSSKTKRESKPIREFVPSEQIRADKAVDFPVDI